MLLEDIARLGLEGNITELELNGLTVVPAARLGNGDQVHRASEALSRIIEERTGVRPDAVEGSTHRELSYPSLYYFFLDDPVFAELLLNEHALTLATYLLGHSCVLSACVMFMKGPGTAAPGRRLQLGLHCDMQLNPEPFPLYAQRANVTWLLSDYTEEAGAVAYVPGSHRFCRHPSDREDDSAAVPIEAAKGSLVVWHGNTWHGSFPRTVPGLRTGLAFDLVRPYLRPVEPLDQDVTAEVLGQHPRRFATLLGQDVPYGWRTEGPDMLKLGRARYRSLLD